MQDPSLQQHPGYKFSIAALHGSSRICNSIRSGKIPTSHQHPIFQDTNSIQQHFTSYPILRDSQEKPWTRRNETVTRHAQNRQSAQLFSSRRYWDSPTPSPAAIVFPSPLVQGGGGGGEKITGGGRGGGNKKKVGAYKFFVYFI